MNAAICAEYGKCNELYREEGRGICCCKIAGAFQSSPMKDAGEILHYHRATSVVTKKIISG